MIIAITSFWDEHPNDLDTMIRSIEGLCERAVFLDGRYAAFPGDAVCSPFVQYDTILSICAKVGIECVIHQPTHAYAGNEVEKRARLFELAAAGTTPDDWFLRIDPDEAVTHHEGVADALARTDLSVAEVRITGISPYAWERADGDGPPRSHRMLFRALTGLTVAGNHWTYRAGNRVLWGHEQEPALDLSGRMTIHHRARVLPGRTARADEYYELRERVGLEK